MGNRQDKMQEFIDRINKKKGDDTSAGARLAGGKRKQLPRIRTGVLSLDISSGGGLPRGKMSLVFGPPSAGKTTIALQVCSAMKYVCHNCKAHIMACACGKFEEGIAMLIDAEGTYDDSWAEANGIDPNNVIIIVPETGEEALEIAEAAVREGVCDLIIVDSLEQCNPIVELEAAMADVKISPLAKLANKFFRKVVQALRTTPNPPHLYVINQPREKMVRMGDNLTLPGGQGQHFAASMKVRLRASVVQPIKGGANEAFVEIQGWFPKNKTHTPRKEFKFNLNLVDIDEANTKGSVNNVEKMVALGRKFNFIKISTSGKEKGQWWFELEDDTGKPVKYSAHGKDGLVNLIKDDEDLYLILYEFFLETALEEGL